MIAFDEGEFQTGRFPHPLKVLGSDEYEMEERQAFIAKRLRILKGSRTAKELARVANTSERTMQGLFDEPHKASHETVNALCVTLGVDISDIRGYADPMAPYELQALYMDGSLTDEDRRIVCDLLQHLYRMRNPYRIHLAEGAQDAEAEDWHESAKRSGIEKAENL